jgi:hypothetical protein
MAVPQSKIIYFLFSNFYFEKNFALNFPIPSVEARKRWRPGHSGGGESSLPVDLPPRRHGRFYGKYGCAPPLNCSPTVFRSRNAYFALELSRTDLHRRNLGPNAAERAAWLNRKQKCGDLSPHVR